MEKLNVACVKADTTVGIGTRSSVFQVTTNGIANGSQLTTYLVMAASVEIYFEELCVVTYFENSGVKTGTFRARHFVKMCVGFVLAFVTSQKMHQVGGTSYRELWLSTSR